jgi:hypothetical protein
VKKLLVIALFGAAVFSYAQTRDDVAIYIPMPVGGTSDQQVFFQDNFIMETTAAGYSIAQSEREGDYTLKLEIKRNMILYDDGTEEEAGPDEKQYLLELRLVRIDDGTEIVMFNFPFTELEEMYEYNLYLLYQAMANVPLTKLTAVPDTDHWRNKWLYIRGSADFNIVAYAMDGSKTNEVSDGAGNWTNVFEAGTGRETPVGPGATLGLELQFLNWMSVEGDIKIIVGTPDDLSFVPTAGVALKFPIKPNTLRSKHFMLEPYVGVDFPWPAGGYIKQFSLLSVGGGFQFAVRGGDMGAFFIDLNGQYSLGDIHTVSPNRRFWWTRWVLGVGIGYKIGFVNRLKD